MDKTVQILISVDSRLEGLEQTIAGLNAGKSAATALGGSLQNAFSIDLVNRFNTGVASIPAMLKESVMAGVKFNATIQDATLGVAAVLKQFNPEKFATFDAALASSAQAIDLLKEKAKQSPATFEQLVGAFQGLSGAATSANIPLKRQVDLVVLLSQGLAGLGIRNEQILQEGRALLTGNITEDAAAARILGITKADIDNAKSSGALFEFLTKKLSAFSEAGTRGAQGYTTAVSNLEDVLTQLKGEAFAPVFEALRTGMLGLNEALAKPETVAALRGMGVMLSDVVGTILKLTQAAVDNAGAIKTTAQVLAVAAAAYAALKLTTWLGSLVQGTAAWTAQSFAVAANTAALRGNAAARSAMNAQAQLATLTRPNAYASMPSTANVALQPNAARIMASMQPTQGGFWRAFLGAPTGGFSSLINVAGIASMIGTLIAGAIAVYYQREVAKIEAGARRVSDVAKFSKQIIAGLQSGELTAEEASAKALSLESEKRRAAQTAIFAGEKEIAAELRQQAELYHLLAKNAEDIAASSAEQARTERESAAAVKEQEAPAANLAAEKRAMASEDLNLLKAKASGNVELIAQAQREKDLADAIAQAEQLGMTASGTKMRYAQTLVGLKEQELALTMRLKNIELAESIGMGTGNSSQTLAAIRAKRARVEVELNRKGGAMPSRQAAPAREPELPTKDGVTGQPDLGLPPLPDMTPEVPENDSPQVRKYAGEYQVQREGDGLNLRRQLSANERLTLQRELQTLKQQEAAEEQRIGELKQQQAQFGRDALLIEEQKRDPLAKTLSEAERQDFLAKEKQQYEQSNKTLVEQGLITQQQLTVQAASHAQSALDAKLAAEAERDAKRDTSAGMKDDKKTLSELKEEYAQIARIISQIEGSTLIPQSQKGQLANGWREKQRINLDRQAGAGEDVRAEQQSLAGQQEQSDTASSFGGQFQSGLVGWVDQLGTAGENAASILTGTLGAAMDGLNQSIYGLITGTNDWNKVWQSVGASALQTVIDLTTKTLLHYAIITPLQTAFHATGEALKAAGTATSVAQGGATAAAWAPASAAVNTATFGASAGIGLPIAIAAIAAIIGVVAAGGFAQGGYTGDGGKYQPAGVVHKGEFVVTKEATARHGVDYLNSLNVNTGRGYSSGGVVDAVTAMPESERRSRNVQVTVVHSDEALRKIVNDHPDTEHRVIRTVAANRGRFGV